MIAVTGLLTEPPRSLYPPPSGLGLQANCQLVADDGRNWLLVDPTGLLVQACGQRVAVSGWTDGHGLFVTGSTPDYVAASAEPAVTPQGKLVLTGRLEPVIAASEPGSPDYVHSIRGLQPRHRLTGQHGSVWLLAPQADLDGLSGNIIQAAGWLIQPQQMMAAEVVRLLPQHQTA